MHFYSFIKFYNTGSKTFQQIILEEKKLDNLINKIWNNPSVDNWKSEGAKLF